MSVVGFELSRFSFQNGLVASISEDGVDPATKLGSSALVSDGGDVPEPLALLESSLESRDVPEPGRLDPGEGAVSTGDGGFEKKFGS